MAISILYLNKQSNCADALSDQMLYHLSLDRSFSHICVDSKKCNYFFSIISDLRNDRKEILFRQEIIQDFENHPALIEQLTSLSMRFDELQIAQRKAEKEQSRLNATGTASSASAKNILQAQALSLKRALLFIQAYKDLLEKYDLKSEGLKYLYSSCKETCENADFRKLINACSKYEHFSENEYWDFQYTLNEEGRIITCDLIDPKHVPITAPESKKKIFSFFKKSEEPVYPSQRINPARDDLYERLSVFALSGLSKLFEKLSEQIFEKYGSIGPELVFYDVVHKYIQSLSEKKTPICYPTFSDDQNIRVKNLYDLYLLMTKPNPADVVANDFILEKDRVGLLVFGNNGSGKTVYLRSIGTMQILAQAGLPIPCESAEITLFSQFATQFSESEKEFCEGNDAGRFEQEVRTLATMVDTLKMGSLVFLNETFQSTAYAEGAEGLYHLLKYFSAHNIRWILVSHLRQLEEMFKDDEAVILYTDAGYKIYNQ